MSCVTRWCILLMSSWQIQRLVITRVSSRVTVWCVCLSFTFSCCVDSVRYRHRTSFKTCYSSFMSALPYLWATLRPNVLFSYQKWHRKIFQPEHRMWIVDVWNDLVWTNATFNKIVLHLGKDIRQGKWPSLLSNSTSIYEWTWVDVAGD